MALTQSVSSSSFASFINDVEKHGFDTASAEWREFFARCKGVQFKSRETVLEALSSSQHILFITSGICAAQHELQDCDTRIARFFCEADLCTLTEFLGSSEKLNKFNNQIQAMTPVNGIVIPMDIWLSEYEKGYEVGHYVRLKMMKTHLFDIELLKVKTMNRTHNSVTFLKEHQPQVLASVPHKFIAQFLGITAEGFSRFLKSGRISS